MKVLVCGSRGWSRRDLVRAQLSQLSQLHGHVTVIHGAARGADTIAGELAEELGLAVIACPADWRRYGRAAGPIRNQQMLTDFELDLVLAFMRDASNSPGTRHMVRIARKAGIETRLFDESGPLPCDDDGQ